MSKINVVIAYANTLLEAGIKSILSSIDNIGKIYSAYDEEKCNYIIRKFEGKLIIIINEKNNLSAPLINSIKSKNPDVRILLISDKSQIDTSEYNIEGFLTTDCDEEEIRDAILSIMQGEKIFCNKVISVMLSNKTSLKKDDCDSTILSKREVEIIALIAKGAKNTEVAEQLFISPHTVATHRKNIMKKLGVSKITGLIHYAIRAKII